MRIFLNFQVFPFKLTTIFTTFFYDKKVSSTDQKSSINQPSSAFLTRLVFLHANHVPVVQVIAFQSVTSIHSRNIDRQTIHRCFFLLKENVKRKLALIPKDSTEAESGRITSR